MKSIILEQLFFELVQVALGVKYCLSHTPNAYEWETLYDIAKKHSLIGVCFGGVQWLQRQQQKPQEVLYLKWMGMAAKIQQRNEIVSRQCFDLQKKLYNDGIRSSIFKGQSVAQLYDALSALRQSGDIDLYVDCGRKRVLSYLKSIGQTNLEWDYVHTHAHFYEDTEVEVHYRAGAVRNLWKNFRLQRFWKHHEEEFFNGCAQLINGSIVCPSKRMHLFYLIHHTYRHLISGGIGLRQMMDLYFALKSRNQKDDTWLKENVDTFGMTRFCQAMVWVMFKVFGMNIVDLPWASDEEEGKFLLDEIMIGGNFGKNDKRFGEGLSKNDLLTQIIKRNWHLASHYGSDALAAPFYYIWHFCWKRLHSA